MQVENRPLTQHGVVGMRKQTGAGKRQVLDKNYFVNELRQKRLDIANETQRMRVRVNWGASTAAQVLGLLLCHLGVSPCQTALVYHLAKQLFGLGVSPCQTGGPAVFFC